MQLNVQSLERQYQAGIEHILQSDSTVTGEQSQILTEADIRFLLESEGFRQFAQEKANDYYRDYVRADTSRFWRYTLWNPQWAEEYVELIISQGRRHPEFARKVDAIVGGCAGRQVVDIGCGFGRFVVETAKLGAEVIGVDLGDEFLTLGKLIAASQGLWANKDFHFAQGTAEKIPLASNSFDVVWSDQTIEHVNNVVDSINEMMRILKPGGFFFIRCPNYLARNIREPHFGLKWPPFRSYDTYQKMLDKDYRVRARNYVVQNPEVNENEIFNLARVDLARELGQLNFVKPYQVANILNKHTDVSWTHMRANYAPARTRWKEPFKIAWFVLKLDVWLRGELFVFGTKGQSLSERLGRSARGLWA